MIAVKGDDPLFRLLTMFELSINLSLSPLTEACTHCTKFLSKLCVEQCLHVLVYVCDEADIY